MTGRGAGQAPPAVAYAFATGRKTEHAMTLLDGFSGILQVDGYAAYKKLAETEREGKPIVLAFCLAHARRKFFEFHKATNSPIAFEALRQIAAVYAIETRIRGMSAAERMAVRQAESKPLMDAFKTWAEERLKEVSAKSPLATAIRYTLNHWQGLAVFLADGRVEVDNNTVERDMRPIGLGLAQQPVRGQRGRGGTRGRSWLRSSTPPCSTTSIPKRGSQMSSSASSPARPKAINWRSFCRGTGKPHARLPRKP